MRTLRGACLAAAFILALPSSAMAQARPLPSLGAMGGAAEAMEWDMEDAADARAINEAGRGAVESGLGHLNTGMDLWDTTRGFLDSDATLSDALNPEDLEFDPDYSPDGAPTVPVHCETEGGPECQQCYQSAYNKLNFVRFYLEKLRGIYGATRNYTEAAISFGDSWSGLHGGFGLAWPPERKGIQDAFDNLGDTYDEKYRGYMEELQEGLQEIAVCEKQYFGEDDWYSRYGFIYYTFMSDRYRR